MVHFVVKILGFDGVIRGFHVAFWLGKVNAETVLEIKTVLLFWTNAAFKQLEKLLS